LSDALKLNQTKLQAEGQKNKKNVLKDYNWETITQKIIGIYKLEPRNKRFDKVVPITVG
jgi:hypothetical protein